MLPGPTSVRKCPGCTRLLKFDTLASGNTFGAVYWTDGKREAPMLPDQPWLVKSPSERVLVWTDECEEVAEILPGEEHLHPEMMALEFAKEPTKTDYIRALKSGMGSTPEKHRYLRVRLWWAFNDQVRHRAADQTPAIFSAEFDNNLRALVEVLDDADFDQRLMHAEVLRELGEFDAALALLSANFPEGFATAVETIRKLAAAGDRFVQPFLVDG